MNNFRCKPVSRFSKPDGESLYFEEMKKQRKILNGQYVAKQKIAHRKRADKLGIIPRDVW